MLYVLSCINYHVTAFLNVCVRMFKESIGTIEKPDPVFIYTNRNQNKSSTVLFSQKYFGFLCYNANHQGRVWRALLLEVVAFLPVDALVINCADTVRTTGSSNQQASSQQEL